MKLILAHEGDLIARDLAAALGGDAHVLTARALSSSGWRHYPVGGGEDALPIAGEVVPASAIDAVITRIAAVSAHDLPHIVEEDRDYIAVEMTSFLLSFLVGLECPLINAPSAGSLMGPSWTTVRWRAAGVQAGFLASSMQQLTGERIVVVGKRCIGAASERTASAALELARIAGVELIGLDVIETADGPQLVGVDPWCALAGEALDVLREQLDRRVS